MKIVLHHASWEFIEREVLPAFTSSVAFGVFPVLPSVRDPRASTGKLQIDMTEEDAHKVRDQLLELFLAKGLQSNDEPNDYGRYVESLSDIFYDALAAE